MLCWINNRAQREIGIAADPWRRQQNHGQPDKDIKLLDAMTMP